MNRTIARLTFCLFLSMPFLGISQKPSILLTTPKRLELVKKQYQQGDPKANAWIKALQHDADKTLDDPLGSVMLKSQTPPSGSKHDYMSLAPYFWPNPNTPNGLPYVRKDGERNPEIKSISDHRYIDNMADAVNNLSLAYYFTGNEAYAQHAATVLRHWFLDSATYMHPNLNFAQAVKGENDGRGIGLIETTCLIQVVNVAGLLSNSPSWSPADQRGLEQWFDQFLHWMLTSKNGMDEHNAKNNHGIWYDAQITAFSLFLHKEATLKPYLQTTLQRIAVQMEPDGRQPLELERTTALGYSTMCLEAWFTTATLAERMGIDFWQYSTADGRSLKKCLDWLLPFALGDKPWPYQQIHDYSPKKLYTLLLQASQHYHNETYYQAAQRIKPKVKEVIAEVYYDK